MLEYELYEEKSLYNSKKPQNVLDDLSEDISYLDNLKVKLKDCETDINNKTVIYSLIASFITGMLITYIGDITILNEKEHMNIIFYNIMHSIISGLAGLIFICTPLSFILEGYKEKFYSFFKKRTSLKNEIAYKNKSFLENIKDPETKRIIISELQDIAKLMKNERDNSNFENHFAQLIKSLSNDNYEYFKNDLLDNFHHWQNVKNNTIKQNEKNKTDKENHNKFLISIGVEPTGSVEKLPSPKNIKSML